MILLGGFVVVLLTVIAYHFWKEYGVWQKFRDIPGPNGLPFFGIMFEIMGEADYMFLKFREYGIKYGSIFRFTLPGAKVVGIFEPDDVEILLKSTKHIEKSHLYALLTPWLNDGLLMSAGKKWQTRRRILTPGFHFNVLKKYMEVILEHANKITKDLRDEKGERVKDLRVWASEQTLNIICETAMGVQFQDGSETAKEYKKAVNEFSAILVYRSVRPWIVPELTFSWTSIYKKYVKMLHTLHSFSAKIIEERKKFHETTNGKYLTGLSDIQVEDNEIPFYTGKNRNLAMIDILINAYRNNEIDDAGLREEVDTFIFEGYDTTAVAMTYAIMNLAEHTEIQDRAREEINEIWEECKGKVGVADIQKFSYLERCIKESLRVFPSVPVIGRQTTEELRLSKYVIPANVTVDISIFDLHRNPSFWPNPDVFDPDRFLPANSQGRHPYSYVPFSAGLRNCIGQKFAMLELKAVIGFLLRDFKLEAIEKTGDIVLISDVVLRAKNPLRVKFIPIAH